MIILDSEITKENIKKTYANEDGFIKGVVDIENEIIALDAEMHYMLSDYLKEEKSSKENDMWGFNLWLNEDKIEDILEFDSFINIRNNQAHGYLRGSMAIEDNKIKEIAITIIKKWIKF